MNPWLDYSRMRIGTYYFPRHLWDEAHVRELAECGISLIVNGEQDERLLDLLHRCGVGMVDHSVMPGWWGGNGTAGRMREENPRADYENAAPQLLEHPALWGIDIGDEPSALDFPYWGEVYAYVRDRFPGRFPYANLYPNYATVAENSADAVVSQLGTATYAEYIRRYCECVPAPYLCYDYYMYHAPLPGAYENLRITSDACRRTGRHLWIVLQVNSRHPDRFTSENQLRHQAFSAMAFGAERIIWACYGAGWWHNQVLDEAGNKTEQYDKLRRVNGEILALGETYMRYRRTDTHFLGYADGDRLLSALPAGTGVQTLSTGTFFDVRPAADCRVIVGEMTARTDDEAHALFLCDGSDPIGDRTAPCRLSLTCRRPLILVTASGKTELTPAADGRICVALPAGGAGILCTK